MAVEDSQCNLTVDVILSRAFHGEESAVALRHTTQCLQECRGNNENEKISKMKVGPD
jgi:hypothetical protein